ncbi:TetR/AcrR family transcriptional regulator [Aquicoccus sp. G2-2]|uniref:TetR/AcrR family transcriptional regulator n=1 Tax=Aquicoccus sp. G2-2 TaxID=3092120 RepID=UPI00366F305B
MSAAEQLFAEKGYQDTRTTDIINASGCSTGSFYHRFSDKTDVARLMVKRFFAASKAEIEALDYGKNAQPDLTAAIISLATFVLNQMDARLGVYRAALRLLEVEPDVWQWFDGLSILQVMRFAEGLQQHRAEIGVADLDDAAINVVQLISMICMQTRMGTGRLFPSDKDELIKVLVRASLGVLCWKGSGNT